MEERKREGLKIQENSQKWNKAHKEECAFFNWWARMERFLKGFDIYPVPSSKEIQSYRIIRKRRKFLWR